jgi:hypothetical protein
VQPDDVVKEGAGDGGGGVGVAERNKMRVLGEAVDHGEDDGLAAHLQKALDEIHRDVRPHLGWNLQRLQQSRRPECLRLVALTGYARAYPVLH